MQTKEGERGFFMQQIQCWGKPHFIREQIATFFFKLNTRINFVTKCDGADLVQDQERDLLEQGIGGGGDQCPDGHGSLPEIQSAKHSSRAKRPTLPAQSARDTHAAGPPSRCTARVT